jgi:hypothetical protein
MPDSLLIEGFQKSPTEAVAGEIAEYQGKTFAHLRTLVPAANGSGEWIRTIKGFAIETARFNEVVAAIKLLSTTAATNTVVSRLQAGREEIWVGFQTFHGNLFAFARRYYKAGNTWKPSPKGINIRAEQVDDLIELAERVLAAIDALGSLGPHPGAPHADA